MIVNYKPNGWEIITQRSHGLLALQLALHWPSAGRKRWAELLAAIAEHDDAQTELERDDLLTAQGGPMDFSMKKFSLEHAQRTILQAAGKSRYVALMCSMHLDFIAGDKAQQTAAVQKFLTAQKALRGTWRRQLAITEEEALADYQLLQWCDALSLLICQRKHQPEQRRTEICAGPGDTTYDLAQPAPGILTVTPWPFVEDQFEVRLERRELLQLKFGGCPQFKKVFEKATVKETCWLIQKTAAGNH